MKRGIAIHNVGRCYIEELSRFKRYGYSKEGRERGSKLTCIRGLGGGLMGRRRVKLKNLC
jgi:hypothetical protein